MEESEEVKRIPRKVCLAYVQNKEVVSLRTALLAIEKGFESHTNLSRPYYTHDGTLNGDVTDLVRAIVRKENVEAFQTTSASSMTDLHYWLIKNYKIHVNVKHIPHNQRYGYNITGSYHEGVNGVLKGYDFKSFESHEEAFDDGLHEALLLIPNKKEDEH